MHTSGTPVALAVGRARARVLARERWISILVKDPTGAGLQVLMKSLYSKVTLVNVLMMQYSEKIVFTSQYTFQKGRFGVASNPILPSYEVYSGMSKRPCAQDYV